MNRNQKIFTFIYFAAISCISVYASIAMVGGFVLGGLFILGLNEFR